MVFSVAQQETSEVIEKFMWFDSRSKVVVIPEEIGRQKARHTEILEELSWFEGRSKIVSIPDQSGWQDAETSEFLE